MAHELDLVQRLFVKIDNHASKRGSRMQVTLSHELEVFVSTKIESGRYASPTEVVTEALHLLEEYDQARAAQRADFNQKPGRRLDSLDQGIHISPLEAHAHLRHKSEQRRQAQV